VRRGGICTAAHRIRAALLGACALTVAAVAWAQPAAQSPVGDYDSVVQSAISEFTAGHYLEARALFTKAHELRPTARTLRGLGLVEFELGRYAQAMLMLRRALVDVRNPLTAAHRVEAEALIEKATAYVASFKITRRPESAEVLVDGEQVALAGDDLVLDVGQHELLIRAPGYEQQTHSIDVRGGEQSDLRFELQPTALAVPNTSEAPEAPKVALSVAREDEAPDAPKAAPSVVRDDTEASTPLSTWGWVAAGTSGLAFGGALLAWQLGIPAANRWNSDACLAGGRTREQNCSADRDAAQTAETWIRVGEVAGIALAVTAVVLLVAGGSTDAPSEGLACGGAASAWGVECSLRL
jgi:tetratricopeptide (TPR) repeat protein